jgi:hypothetical protein
VTRLSGAARPRVPNRCAVSHRVMHLAQTSRTSSSGSRLSACTSSRPSSARCRPTSMLACKPHPDKWLQKYQKQLMAGEFTRCRYEIVAGSTSAGIPTSCASRKLRVLSVLCISTFGCSEPPEPRFLEADSPDEIPPATRVGRDPGHDSALLRQGTSASTYTITQRMSVPHRQLSIPERHNDKNPCW